MISQTAEYALRAIAHLAEHHGEPCTSQQIAECTHVPQDYMSKVLKGLVNSGMVTSQRGLYGGFRLAVEPDELPVSDVIEAVSPLQRIHECPLGRKHEGGKLCPLHRLLDDAMKQIETVFREMTIGELLASDRKGSAMCDGQKREKKINVTVKNTSRKTASPRSNNTASPKKARSQNKEGQG